MLVPVPSFDVHRDAAKCGSTVYRALAAEPRRYPHWLLSVALELVAWVCDGTPEGNPRGAPPPDGYDADVL
jgi:hypothetical protein